MKDWEKRNAEEMVEGLVGMDLAGIEKALGDSSTASVVRLGDYLAERYQANCNSFAGVLQGVCVIELARRKREGGGDE